MKLLSTFSFIYRVFVIGCTIFAFLLFVGFDIQHDDGIVGATKKNGNGCTCHNLEPNNSVHVWITGPIGVQPGSSATYTVHTAGGPAITGGFNVAALNGTLSVNSAATQVMSGELTHISPKAFTIGAVTWDFNYQAPLSEGTDTLHSEALSTNNNFTPDAADQWNFGNNFVVYVNSQPPTAVPALSEWGISFLALLLVGSGIWFMTKRRAVRQD